jgi:alkylated DNA repair dioxygenase AlkB
MAFTTNSTNLTKTRSRGGRPPCPTYTPLARRKHRQKPCVTVTMRMWLEDHNTILVEGKLTQEGEAKGSEDLLRAVGVRREYVTPRSWLDFFTLPHSLNTQFDSLWSLCPPTQHQVRVWGQMVTIPRFHQSYGRSYRFSGVEHQAKPVPPELFPYLEWVNELGYGTFDEILINWYMDGTHYISSHSDDEPQIKPGSPIVSISLGAKRMFRLRDARTREKVRDVPMVGGCVLVMGGDFQRELKHEVPKINGRKGAAVGSRINITFRQMKD